MPTKLRFEVQGKSPLVFLAFYNDDFEKNLAKENPEANIVSIACDRGDRYLSTGLFPSE